MQLMNSRLRRHTVPVQEMMNDRVMIRARDSSGGGRVNLVSRTRAVAVSVAIPPDGLPANNNSVADRLLRDFIIRGVAVVEVGARAEKHLPVVATVGVCR